MPQKSKNEEFEELAFEEQCKQVYETPIAEKGDLIIRSQDPVRLVNSFSVEELYLTVREMDRDNMSEIIQYANAAQLQFISDFECWHNDRISQKGFIQWLEVLEAAGDTQLMQWLLTTEFSMLIAGFKKYVTVLKPYHEETVDEVIGDNPYFTLDNMYYIMIDEENLQIVKRAVAVLFEGSRTFYVNLLEGIMSETDDIIEEQALQERLIRLSEKGFPEKNEAMRIYRALTHDEWQRYARREGLSRPMAQETQVLPLYPAVWREEKLFLDDVFATFADIAPEDVQAIYQELIWISNKILICEGADGFSETLVKKAFNHARYVLNCGLEALSDRDIMKGRAFLLEYWIEYLFRWGITQIINVRLVAERAIKKHWVYSLEAALDLFDAPYGSTLRGLLRTHPLFFDPAYQDDFYSLRAFHDTRDIRVSHERMQVFAGLCKLLSTGPFIGWDTYIQEFHASAHLDSSDVRLSTLVNTLFLNYALGKTMRIQPLSEKELKRCVKKIFLGRGGAADEPQLKAQMKAGFIEALYEAVHGLAREEFNGLKTFFDISFASLEEELGMLRKSEHPDYRFVQSVLLHAAPNND
jgi:hypothetical protein